MTVRANVDEATECRQCCAFCDKTVHPRGCIEMDCPFLYTYGDERSGTRYMGCLQKVFGVEIDVDLFERAERTRHGLRWREGGARAAPDVPVQRRALLRGHGRRLRLRQPALLRRRRHGSRAATAHSTCASAIDLLASSASSRSRFAISI